MIREKEKKNCSLCISNWYLLHMYALTNLLIGEIIHWLLHCNSSQGCRKQGAQAPPVFGRSINPISTRGGEGTFSPPSTMSPPGFSDLATALSTITLANLYFWPTQNWKLQKLKIKDTINVTLLKYFAEFISYSKQIFIKTWMDLTSRFVFVSSAA